MKVTEPIKGYKVVLPDGRAKEGDMLYKVGKSYVHPGQIKICNEGYHFCLKASHCFSYYSFDPKNKVFEVECIEGEYETHESDSKICCSHIHIVRELTWSEVLIVANEGGNCTGYGNSGNRNSGDWNSGNRNSGYSNSGDWGTGAFCIDRSPFMMFDKKSKWTAEDFQNSRVFSIMQTNLNQNLWIPGSLMSEDEKKANPKWETTEGYLKTITLKEAWKNMWGNLSKESKEEFYKLPNWDKSKFSQITGLDIKEI